MNESQRQTEKNGMQRIRLDVTPIVTPTVLMWVSEAELNRRGNTLHTREGNARHNPRQPLRARHVFELHARQHPRPLPRVLRRAAPAEQSFAWFVRFWRGFARDLSFTRLQCCFPFPYL